MENILEKRRVKIEKNEDEKFLTFYLSCSLQNMITNISIFSDHKINKIFGFFVVEKLYNKALFSPRRFKWEEDRTKSLWYIFYFNI